MNIDDPKYKKELYEIYKKQFGYIAEDSFNANLADKDKATKLYSNLVNKGVSMPKQDEYLYKVGVLDKDPRVKAQSKQTQQAKPTQNRGGQNVQSTNTPTPTLPKQPQQTTGQTAQYSFNAYNPETGEIVGVEKGQKLNKNKTPTPTTTTQGVEAQNFETNTDTLAKEQEERINKLEQQGADQGLIAKERINLAKDYYRFSEDKEKRKLYDKNQDAFKFLEYQEKLQETATSKGLTVDDYVDNLEYVQAETFLDDKDKEEFNIIQDLKAAERVLESFGSEELKGIQAAKLEALKSRYKNFLAKKYEDTNSELSSLKRKLVIGELSDDEEKEAKERITYLEKSKGNFFKTDEDRVAEGVKTAEASFPTLVDILPKNLSPSEKFSIYYQTLYQEHQELRKKIENGGVGRLAGEAVGSTFGMQSQEMTRYTELQRLLYDLAPIALINKAPVRGRDGFLGSMYQSALETIAPVAKGLQGTNLASETNLQNALRVTGTEEDVTPEVLKGITSKYKVDKETGTIQGYKNWTREATGQTLGASLGMMTHMIASAPASGAVLPKLGATWNTIVMSGKAPTVLPRVYNFLSGAVKSGAEYSIAGAIFQQSGEELDFSSGAAGFIGESTLKGLLSPLKGLAQPLNLLFGTNTTKVLSQMTGRGMGEVAEETAQSLIQIYNSSPDSTARQKKLQQMFGTWDDTLHFAFQTFVMGAMMGVGSKTGRDINAEAEKAIASLPPEKRAILDKAVEAFEAEIGNATEQAVSETAQELEIEPTISENIDPQEQIVSETQQQTQEQNDGIPTVTDPTGETETGEAGDTTQSIPESETNPSIPDTNRTQGDEQVDTNAQTGTTEIPNAETEGYGSVSNETAEPLRDVESTTKALDLDDKSIDDINLFWDEIQDTKNKDVRILSNMLDNVSEKKERDLILNNSLDKVAENIDYIFSKDSFVLEKREGRDVKEVAKKYQGEVSIKEAIKDFKDAFFGNPGNNLADALKMREAVRVYIENGGKFRDLLSFVKKEFESDGFSELDAAGVVKGKLDSITKKDFRQQQLAEAYHKAKADGSNPELVQAIERILAPKNETQQQTQTTQETPTEASNQANQKPKPQEVKAERVGGDKIKVGKQTYKTTKDSKGRVRIVDSKNKPISKRSPYYKPIMDLVKEEAVSEIANSEAPFTQVPSDATPAQYYDEVANKSNNPAEVATAYAAQPTDEALFDQKEKIIADRLGRVSQRSFAEFGDLNQIKGTSTKLQYFSSKESPDTSIDTIAEVMSEETGVEITPQDIVEFIIKYPSGIGVEGSSKSNQNTFFGKNQNPTKQALADRFQEITGLELNEEYAEQILNYNAGQQNQQSTETGEFISEADTETARQEDARLFGEQSQGTTPQQTTELTKQDVETLIETDPQIDEFLETAIRADGTIDFDRLEELISNDFVTDAIGLTETQVEAIKQMLAEAKRIQEGTTDVPRNTPETTEQIVEKVEAELDELFSEPPKQAKPESKSNLIQAWRDEFQSLKSKKDLEGIQTLYEKVKIALNELAEKSNTVKEFEAFKKEIEQYVEGVKESTKKPSKKPKQATKAQIKEETQMFSGTVELEPTYFPNLDPKGNLFTQVQKDLLKTGKKALDATQRLARYHALRAVNKAVERFPSLSETDQTRLFNHLVSQSITQDGVLATANFDAENYKDAEALLKTVPDTTPTTLASSSGRAVIPSIFSFRKRSGKGNANTDKPAASFKLFDKIVQLHRKYNKRGKLQQKNLRRGIRGLYYLQIAKVELSALNDMAVAIHELSHAIDDQHGIISSIIDPQVKAALIQYYKDHYPAPDNNLSENIQMMEGFAMFIQNYTSDKVAATSGKPGVFGVLVDNFIKKGGKYNQPIINEFVDDIEALIEEFQMLPKIQQIGSLSITDKTAAMRAKNPESMAQKANREIFDRVADFESMARASGTAMTSEDVSLAIRTLHSLPTRLGNNLTGKSSFFGIPGIFEKLHQKLKTSWLGKVAKNFSFNEFWGADKDGNWSKLHDFNYGTIMEEIQAWGKSKDMIKNQALEEFSAFLIARRVNFEYKELADTQAVLDAIDDRMAKAARNKDEELVQKLTAQKTRVEERAAQLEETLENDGILESDAEEVYNQYAKEFKSMTDKMDALIRHDLQTLRDTGLITEEAFQELTQREGYVPFKRLMDYNEYQTEDVPTLNASQTGKIGSLKQRRGSKKPIINPFISAQANHLEIQRKAQIQRINQSLLSMATKSLDKDHPLNGQFKVIESPTLVEIQEAQNNKAMVLIKQGGKNKIVEFQNPVMGQYFFENITTDNQSFVEKMVGDVDRFFKASTTGTYVAFAATNFLLLDQATAFVNSRNSYIPIVSPVYNLLMRAVAIPSSLEAQYLKEYMFLSSGSQSSIEMYNRKFSNPTQILRNQAQGKQTILSMIRKGWKTLMDVLSLAGNVSELSVRGTDYILARKNGKSPAVALEEAGRLTGSFHHRGRLGNDSATRTALKSPTYLTATLQHLKQYAESAKRTEKDGLLNSSAQQRVVAISAFYIAPVVANMAYLLQNDDEDKKRYETFLTAQSPEILAKYIYLPIQLGGKGYLQIRVPDQYNFIANAFNLAMLSYATDRTYSAKDYYKGTTAWIPDQAKIHEPIAQMLYSFADKDITTKDNLLAGSGYLVKWFPAPVKGAVFTGMEYSDFPEIRQFLSYADKSVLPFEQQNEYTSPLAKYLATQYGESFSPKMFDKFLESVMGRTAKYFTGKETPFTGINKTFYKELWVSSAYQATEYFNSKDYWQKKIKSMKKKVKENEGGYISPEGLNSGGSTSYKAGDKFSEANIAEAEELIDELYAINREFRAWQSESKNSDDVASDQKARIILQAMTDVVERSNKLKEKYRE